MSEQADDESDVEEDACDDTHMEEDEQRKTSSCRNGPIKTHESKKKNQQNNTTGKAQTVMVT